MRTHPSAPPFSMTLRSHQKNPTAANQNTNAPPNANDNSLRASTSDKRSSLNNIDQPHTKRPRIDTGYDDNKMRAQYAQAAINNVKPSTTNDRQALMASVDSCFNDITGAQIDRHKFPTNVWQQPRRIKNSSATFCDVLSSKIASVSNTHLQALAPNQTPSNTEAELRAETIIREAVSQTLNTLGDDFTQEEPLSFFVFDTETNRLSGDILSIGWVRLDIKNKADTLIECRNCILPPNTIAYGAERIHKMSPDWLKTQHASGNTTTAETAARLWLEHALGSQSVIGFNTVYDLTALKRLLHTTGVERDKAEALMAQISKAFSIDAQHFLLRIDPVTRHNHKLPFSDTIASHKFASDDFDNHYTDGSPITFMPNRKLVSYADGFLGMQTEGAHDALYDCVMTLAGFAKSLGLRNEVLDHERNFTRKSAKQLTQYDLTNKPHKILKRDIIAPGKNPTENNRITIQADSPHLFQNPALKTTPFIYNATGPTVHRRHIIPKSTLAHLLLPNRPHNQFQEYDHNNPLDNQGGYAFEELNTLYHQCLDHPNFLGSAQDRLSETALKICEAFKQANSALSEYNDPGLVSAVSEFVKGIEKANNKNVPIRYFERNPAKQFLQGLPLSADIKRTGTVSIPTMRKVMGAILYSFYHSLEFNQFIGPGAENLVAGRIFHNLEKLEPEALTNIANAPDTDTLKNVFMKWLNQLQAVLEVGACDTSEDDIETQLRSLAPTTLENHQAPDDEPPRKKVSRDTVLYFLEIQKAIHGFLSTFLDYDLTDNNDDTNKRARTDSLATAQNLKERTLHKLSLIQAIAGHQPTKTAFTFEDRQWFSAISAAHAALSDATTKQAIDAALNKIGQNAQEALNRLNEAELYEGDKALLSTLVNTLLAERTIKPDLLNFTPTPTDPTPGITGFVEKQHDNPLNNIKHSVSSFIKAIKDNTAYDIPSNAARALQNSHLLPLYQNISGNNSLSQADKISFLNGLLDADHDIATALRVTRETDTSRPLHADYMPYLI